MIQETVAIENDTLAISNEEKEDQVIEVYNALDDATRAALLEVLKLPETITTTDLATYFKLYDKPASNLVHYIKKAEDRVAHSLSAKEIIKNKELVKAIDLLFFTGDSFASQKEFGETFPYSLIAKYFVLKAMEPPTPHTKQLDAFWRHNKTFVKRLFEATDSKEIYHILVDRYRFFVYSTNNYDFDSSFFEKFKNTAEELSKADLEMRYQIVYENTHPVRPGQPFFYPPDAFVGIK
ncbi:MAG: hypothetical protein V5B36_00865 [Candidatus Accumulibacter sp. UW25]|jgi:hypothetical protein